MKKLRNFYLGRLMREKVLLLLFVVTGVLMWASSFGGRAVRFVAEHRRDSATLQEQAQWLDDRLAIESAAKKAVENLEPGRTLDGPRLIGELSQLAGQVGLANTSSEGDRTESTGQFAVHTVQFTVRKTDWEKIRKFYAELSKRSPYIGIEQFSLQADRANPAQLNASLRVSSVEIARPSGS